MTLSGDLGSLREAVMNEAQPVNDITNSPQPIMVIEKREAINLKAPTTCCNMGTIF